MALGSYCAVINEPDFQRVEENRYILSWFEVSAENTEINPLVIRATALSLTQANPCAR